MGTSFSRLFASQGEKWILIAVSPHVPSGTGLLCGRARDGHLYSFECLAMDFKTGIFGSLEYLAIDFNGVNGFDCLWYTYSSSSPTVLRGRRRMATSPPRCARLFSQHSGFSQNVDARCVVCSSQSTTQRL